jgi:anti-sigma factor RsiW
LKALTCEHYEELASALADGFLEAAEIAVLQDHLGGCEECRLFTSRIYRIRDLLRAEEVRESPPAVSAGFAAAVANRISKERVFTPAPAVRLVPERSSYIKHFMGAAAAAVVLLSAGWSSYRLAGPEEAPTVVASVAVSQESEEGSMASYFREYALQAMDTTFLGLPPGVELAGFELPGRTGE